MLLTEVEIAEKLFEIRAKQAGFIDTSFDTISGSGANGEIIHYQAQPDTYSIVDDKKSLLARQWWSICRWDNRHYKDCTLWRAYFTT